MSDELFEHKTKTQHTREEAAKRIHELADAIARHNEVSYVENNKTVRVDIPDTVQLKIEIERGTEESELEIEISW
ncbi:amphi-Trp domain-containing protein [Gordonia sp. (in: high G+C Gram-positive bacteria)]|uniref:amphi-Trp domain-containing protein n=1 Tax=Gordonia sp. (in: high G+C Gram-positive bacteria) TaxID=84139 RepID=UPI0035B2D6B3